MIIKKAVSLLLFVSLLVALLFTHSCREPFDVEVIGSRSYLIVDGTIVNKTQDQIISIFETNETASFKSSEFTSTISPKASDLRPVSGAKLKVFENKVNTFELTEVEPGYYKMPSGFSGKIGSSYVLEIITKEGKRISSTAETMLPVSAIDRVYDNFNPTGINDRLADGGKIATNDVYIDFKDPKEQRNFYRWKWISYELQNICASCKQGRYYITTQGVNRSGICERDPTLLPFDFFDYECEAFCWDIFLGSRIDIFSDIYTDGLLQKDKLVAQIPLYQSNPCLVVLEQYSMTANAYRYLKLIQDQSQNTGTLADTPPAPLRGNLTDLSDPTRLILGYFTASALAEARYMLDRKNTRGGLPNTIFKFRNKRDPIFESPSPERPFIPLAICEPSIFRTPNSPEGWQFGIR